MPDRLRAAPPWICAALFLIGAANFIWFFVESSAIGGDALNGYVRDGHYFVVSHGRATEVSAAVWTWSRIHAMSVFITHPVAIGAGIAFAATGGNLRLAGLRGSAAERRARAGWALAGEFLAADSASVRLGAASIGRSPTVVVTSRGLVARVGWESLTILATEIRDVTEGSTLGRARVAVFHEGIEVPSPLVLGVGSSSGLAAAVRSARSAAPGTRRLESLGADAPGPGRSA